MHPYQESILAMDSPDQPPRFWESSAYTFAGSFLWETGGETSRLPSMIRSPAALPGPSSGVLFRMASLVLEAAAQNQGSGVKLAATAISPPTGLQSSRLRRALRTRVSEQ